MNLRPIIVPLASGLLFGAGLQWGGMTDPDRVRGFLDLGGRWDATLGFVMAGAIIVMVPAWWWQRRHRAPWLADQFSLPDRRAIDRPLIGGALLFGVGWGLAGLCPGPAVAALAFAPAALLPFIAAMLVGMALHRLAIRHRS